MATKARKPNKTQKLIAQKRLEFRIQHNSADFVVGGEDRGGVSIVQQENPLRIDKLLNNGVIDGVQHSNGLLFIRLSMAVGRQFLSAMRYPESPPDDTDKSIIASNIDGAMAGRMDAESSFRIIIANIPKRRDYDIVSNICLHEMTATDAVHDAEPSVKRDNKTVYVRNAFDVLGNAIRIMREKRKELEKIVDTSERFHYNSPNSINVTGGMPQ